MNTEAPISNLTAGEAVKYYVTRLLEWTGALKPKLFATLDIDITWTEVEYDEDDDEDKETEWEETITFFLLEYPSGQRDYRVHEYGKNYDTAKHEEFLKEILVWCYGGPLPAGAEKVGEPAPVIAIVPTKDKKKTDE